MTTFGKAFMCDQAMAQLQRSIKALPTERRSFLTACSAAEDDWQHYQRTRKDFKNAIK